MHYQYPICLLETIPEIVMIVVKSSTMKRISTDPLAQKINKKHFIVKPIRSSHH